MRLQPQGMGGFYFKRIYEVKKLSVEGKFLITVKGWPIDRDKVIVFRNICSSYVKMIDKKFNLEEVFFSKISVIFKWSGIPREFGSSQLLLKFLDTSIGKYFLAWELSFVMKLIEKEK